MKVVNIVLCSLIFVFALVSAVFSYFLFDKRASLVESNVKMAALIGGSSQKLAPATTGQAVSKDDLSHQKYVAADMDRKLANVEKQVSGTVTQRDTLAETMMNTGKAVGIKGLELDSVKRLDGVEKILAKVKSLQLRFNRNNECFREMGQVLGINFNQSNYDFTPASYDSSVKKIRDAVRRCKRDMDRAIEEKNAMAAEKREAERERDEYRTRFNNANREKENLRGELTSARRSNETIRKELDRVKNDYYMVTRTKYGEIPVIQDGTAEARALVVGEVKEVNPGHGFIAIDLTNTQRFKHKIGEKEYEVDPKLRPGLELVICRGDVSGASKPEFIARVKIYSIDDTCSIANIPADVAKQIRVGDKVIDISRFEVMQKNETK